MDGENVQQGNCIIPTLTAFQVRILKQLARGKTKALVTCGSTSEDKQKDRIDQELNEVRALVGLKLLALPEEEELANVTAIARKHVGDDREIYPVILTLKGQCMFERFAHAKFVN